MSNSLLSLFRSIVSTSRTLIPGVIFGGLITGLAPLASAQSPAAAQANEAAYNLYLAGNYEEAAAAYKKFLTDFPTDGLIPVATVQLGFALFFTGEFDQALATLEKAQKDPTLPDELKPVLASFIPQVLAAKAAAMPPDQAGRKAAFEAAIAKFGDFLKEFPKAEQVEAARYGQALAKYQIENFDGVVEDLETNINAFPNSPSIQESENLLALTLATQGGRELAKGDSADRAKGNALLDRAVALLQGIIDKKTNLTLVNDAQFQLAEILFSKGSFAPEEDRPELYAKAMAAYRAVMPNEEIIAMQEEKLAGLPERRLAILRSRNQAAMKAFEREVDREQRRLGELKAKADMISTAGLRMGEIYFNQGQINQSRVVLRHLAPFFTKEDEKKRAAYFTALGYALQSQAAAAEEAYQAFQTEYKADPLAQNLPLAVGTMFLNHPDPSVNSPTKAIEYFDESLALYPKGQLAGLTTVTKASAQTRLGQMQAAEETFKKFLAGSPTPDEWMIAQTGLADIYKVTAKWDDAIAAYQAIIEKYPDRPQAVDAQFWIAIGTKEKGDNPAAIPLLEKALEAHPDSPLVPTAMFSLARAKLESGDSAGASAVFAELAEKFPDSPPAPFTYFMRTQIAAREQNTAEMDRLMRAFIEKYPQDEKVYFAFDSIGQNALRAGRWEDAISPYQEFSEKYPADARSASALLKAAEFRKQWAESLGRYGALSTDERAVWEERMNASIATAEAMLERFPESPDLALGIQTLTGGQKALINAELKNAEQVEAYFNTLAERASTEAVRSKILFGLASWLAEQDPDRALVTMQEAYNPEVIYAPADLDTFAIALLDKGQAEKAEEIFVKLGNDYPIPDGSQPQAAPPNVQQAQAVVLFGRARVAQEKGLTSEAGQLFEQLKSLYPWSPKVLEAELGIAEADFASGRLDPALGRLPGIIRSPNATADLRAKGMLLGGKVMQKKAETAPEAKAKEEALAAAVDYYIKIDQFYSGVPTIAAEGLFLGGQMLEKQASTSSDAVFKKRQLDLAKRSYQDLVKKYPNSPFAEQAKARIAALGGA